MHGVPQNNPNSINILYRDHTILEKTPKRLPPNPVICNISILEDIKINEQTLNKNKNTQLIKALTIDYINRKYNITIIKYIRTPAE